jgi:hypothetical protein
MQYFIPAMLAFLGAVILWVVKRQRKELEYEIVASEPFPHGAKTGKYHVIRLRNSGNVAIQDARFAVGFEQGTIESSRWSDARLVADVNTGESRLECAIPLLNPRENIALTITTLGDHQLSSPKVEARAVGVTATAKTDERTASTLSVIAGVASVAALATSGFMYWMLSQRADIQRSIDTLRWSQPGRLSGLEKRTAELEQARREESEGKPDSAQIIFAILNRAGVGHLTSQIVAAGQNVTYWGTGLLIVDSFLLDEENGQKYVTALEELVKSPMAASSLGFNLYLLSKVERFRGNAAKATDYLDRCKKETPLMYQHLVEQDQYFDLKLLQKQLRAVRR